MSSYYNQLCCFFLFSYIFFLLFRSQVNSTFFIWNNKHAVNHCRIVSNLHHFSALLCLFGRYLSYSCVFSFGNVLLQAFLLFRILYRILFIILLQPLIITMPHSIQSMSTDMHIFIVACIVSFHYTPHISSLFAIYHNETKYAFWFILSVFFFIYVMSALTITINFP